MILEEFAVGKVSFAWEPSDDEFVFRWTAPLQAINKKIINSRG